MNIWKFFVGGHSEREKIVHLSCEKYFPFFFCFSCDKTSEFSQAARFWQGVNIDANL